MTVCTGDTIEFKGGVSIPFSTTEVELEGIRARVSIEEDSITLHLLPTTIGAAAMIAALDGGALHVSEEMPLISPFSGHWRCSFVDSVFQVCAHCSGTILEGATIVRVESSILCLHCAKGSEAPE